MLDSDLQEIKICDFGEARRFSADSDVLTGHCGTSTILTCSIILSLHLLTLLGTPYYQALEIWQRGKYTKAVDMWACGVVLYVMVAKLQPWDYYFEEQFDQDDEFDPNVDQLRG